MTERRSARSCSADEELLSPERCVWAHRNLAARLSGRNKQAGCHLASKQALSARAVRRMFPPSQLLVSEHFNAISPFSCRPFGAGMRPERVRAARTRAVRWTAHGPLDAVDTAAARGAHPSDHPGS